MPSPPAYNQTTDFSNDEAGAVAGRSTVRTANLDTEFVNIEATLDQIVANLALSQSSDGSPLDDWVDLPSLAPDAITWISTNGNGWYATDTGTVNTMVVTLDPAATALTNGMFVVTDIKLTNTATAVTLNVNGLGAKVVVTDGAGAVPAIGALTIGTFYGFQYDLSADKFQIAFSGDSIVHSAAAETSAAAAAASATAAAASYDSFDDRYLGTKSSDPSVDNDGATLLDGALYFNTSTNVMMVYDLGGTTWNRTTPTSSDQTKINTVSGIASDVTAVAAKATEIGRLGTADAVTDMSILGTAAIVTDMSILGTAAVVEDMSILGTADTVTDMSILATSDIVTDMSILATPDIVTDMSILGTAAIVEDMSILGTSGNVTAMATCATNMADVNNFVDQYTISGSAPGSPSEGDLWYDSSANILKVHNGTSFVAVTSATAGITDVVDDTTPQLGGNLDLQTYTLSNVSLANGGFYSNPNMITADATVTTAALKNMFLMGQITVNDTYTWTIAGDGVLQII